MEYNIGGIKSSGLKVKSQPTSKYGIQFGTPGSEYEFQQENLLGRYKDITDFNSPFYAQYRKYLQSAMPKIGTNAMLAPLMAGNVDYGTAQKLGSMRATEMQGQQNEAINKGVMGFGLEMQGQANPLLGQMGQNYFNIMNYWENQRQFNAELDQRKSENKQNWLGQGLGLIGGLGSMFGGDIISNLLGSNKAKQASPYGG